MYLTLHQHGHVHEHVVELLDGGLQLHDVGVPRLDVGQRLLGGRRVHDDALGEDGRVALLDHVLELGVGGGAAGDLELALDPVLAALPVVGLRAVVLRHDLDELARERRVLGLADAEVGRGLVDGLLGLDVLLDD